MMVLADYNTLILFVRLIDVLPIHSLVFANSIILYLCQINLLAVAKTSFQFVLVLPVFK